MGSAPETPGLPTKVDPRWLWGMRVAALMSVPLIWAIAYAGVSFARHAIWLALILALPFFWPYLWVVWRLGWPGRVKGLVEAVGLGSATLLICLLPLLVAVASRARSAVYFVLLVVAQVVLIGGALKAYSDRREVRRQGLRSGVVYLVMFLFFFFLWAMMTPSLLVYPRTANGALAVGRLRTLSTAAVTYESRYENGYPRNLQVLTAAAPGAGESCDHAGLIDEVLGGGVVGGYRFDYRPGAMVEKPGPGCAAAGVKSYRIHARPLRYKKTGLQSFFTDESGVIRWTVENRAATPADPPL